VPIFNKISNLVGYIEIVTIPEIANVIETEGKEELNKQVEEKLYKDAFVGNSDFYTHTFGIRNSAMAEMMKVGNSRVGKGILIDIYINPKSSYYSFYPTDSKENVTDKIVNWLDGGHSGRYKNFNIDYKGRGFFESTYKNLAKGGKLKKAIIRNLKRFGYVIGR